MLVPVVVAALVAGLWFCGFLPSIGARPARAEATSGPSVKPEQPASPPVFFDLPEIVANLDAGPRRTGFVRVRAKLELARVEDQPAVAAALPRILDLFQTYLREMRPEDLRGSMGMYRLREELIARASIAAAPARVTDVLFIEMLVQ